MRTHPGWPAGSQRIFSSFNHFLLSTSMTTFILIFYPPNFTTSIFSTYITTYSSSVWHLNVRRLQGSVLRSLFLSFHILFAHSISTHFPTHSSSLSNSEQLFGKHKKDSHKSAQNSSKSENKELLSRPAVINSQGGRGKAETQEQNSWGSCRKLQCS